MSEFAAGMRKGMYGRVLAALLCAAAPVGTWAQGAPTVVKVGVLDSLAGSWSARRMLLRALRVFS